MSSGRCNHFSFTPGRGRIVPSPAAKMCGASVFSDRGVAARCQDAMAIPVGARRQLTRMQGNEISETGSGPCRAKEIESVKMEVGTSRPFRPLTD